MATGPLSLESCVYPQGARATREKQGLATGDCLASAGQGKWVGLELHWVVTYSHNGRGGAARGLTAL